MSIGSHGAWPSCLYKTQTAAVHDLLTLVLTAGRRVRLAQLVSSQTLGVGVHGRTSRTAHATSRWKRRPHRCRLRATAMPPCCCMLQASKTRGVEAWNQSGAHGHRYLWTRSHCQIGSGALFGGEGIARTLQACNRLPIMGPCMLHAYNQHSAVQWGDNNAGVNDG